MRMLPATSSRPTEQYDSSCVVGRVGWRQEGGVEQAFNSVMVVGPQGELVAVYDKHHLFETVRARPRPRAALNRALGRLHSKCASRQKSFHQVPSLKNPMTGACWRRTLT